MTVPSRVPWSRAGGALAANQLVSASRPSFRPPLFSRGACAVAWRVALPRDGPNVATVSLGRFMIFAQSPVTVGAVLLDQLSASSSGVSSAIRSRKSGPCARGPRSFLVALEGVRVQLSALYLTERAPRYVLAGALDCRPVEIEAGADGSRVARRSIAPKVRSLDDLHLSLEFLGFVGSESQSRLDSASARINGMDVLGSSRQNLEALPLHACSRKQFHYPCRARSPARSYPRTARHPSDVRHTTA